MGSTYYNLEYHIVFSTKNRKPWISEILQTDLYRYIGACVKQFGALPLAVGGVEDHIHLLVAVPPKYCIADLLREIKAPSSRWMHTEGKVRGFAWQDGYAAFSVSRSHHGRVVQYIRNQRRHHDNERFDAEMLRLLDEAGIAYDERYLFG